MEALSHIIRGEEFILLPDKAIYWPLAKALLVADLHLGKATHFRKAGIAVPASVELENLDRLSQLILNNEVEKIYILGDLFHSYYNAQWRVFKQFMAQFAEYNFILIKGNHDILEREAYIAQNLTMHEESLEVGPFIMTHIPLEQKHERYNICGHLHPGVLLRGTGLQSLKLPCYYFGQDGLILPAFGTFTGLAKIDPKKNDTVFAISDQSVIQVL